MDILFRGHVNGVARISKWFARAENWFLEIVVPEKLSRYCIDEGSITIDGISLTIASIVGNTVGVNIIPHTVKSTILQYKCVGNFVNIEVDVIAKYLEKLIQNQNINDLSIDKLRSLGY